MSNDFMSMKENVPNLTLPDTSPVRDVLKTIDRGGLGVALLEDADTCSFRGLVTDGDVRRALLQGIDLNSPASAVSHPETVTAGIDTPIDEIAKKFTEKVRLIPLLNKQNRVVDISVFDYKMHIPVASPLFSGNELKYVSECILTGWVSSTGKYVSEFEHVFAKFCNTNFAVATSSGTTALHLALLAIGVGPGDEVIVPSFTFISTANAVRFAGATPVFVDCESATWNIDPLGFKDAITEKTKAVIPVHLYGHPSDMDPVIEIAQENNIKIIEDAAEAHGALYKGRKVGSLGDIGIFSFYGNKTITTGEGGMVVTDDQYLVEKIRILRDHGMDPNKRYEHSVLGYNYRMTNIQAALGVAQMEQIDQIIDQKRKNASLYKKGLETIPGITLPPEKKWAKNIFWLYSILVDENEFGMSASELGNQLLKMNIDTRPLFPPIHHQPIYDTKQSLPVCEMLSSRGLSLPSSVRLAKNEIESVVVAIKSICKAGEN